jgi:hypothetical protein
MNWVGFAEIVWVPFMMAYCLFMIIAAYDCLMLHFSNTLKIRYWFGSTGLGICLISSLFYLVNYADRVLWYKEIASGSTLVIFYFLGFMLAFIGFILGCIGLGRIRLYSIIAGVVMSFQWLGWMTSSIKGEAFLANVMYFFVALIVIIAIIHRMVSNRYSQK